MYEIFFSKVVEKYTYNMNFFPTWDSRDICLWQVAFGESRLVAGDYFGEGNDQLTLLRHKKMKIFL